MQDRAELHERVPATGPARCARGGIPTEVFLEPSHLRNQIGYASSNGIPLAVIAGESEMREGLVKVKDLRSRVEETVQRADLVAHVRSRSVG